MKKIIFTLSLCLSLAFTSVSAFADEVIIRIDSDKVIFNDNTGKPFIDKNWRTQVPFRQTLEQYGATVEWNNEKRIAIATKGDITIEIPIGKNYIIKNGTKIANDTTSIIINQRTFLPIRKVMEAFESEVEWDHSMNTVVITQTPFDKKALLLNAYQKSNAWESFDSRIIMDMSMPLSDENNIDQMAMKMKMYTSAFTNPMKIKMAADVEVDFMGEIMSQPFMEMYMTVDDNTTTQYMGIYDEAGELTWQKSTTENELLLDTTGYNEQDMELLEQYITDVKYFGKYNVDGNTLLKFQYVITGDIFDELMGEYLNLLSQSTAEEDIFVADMFKDMKDIQLIMYIDEESGELSKYEIDLSPIISSIFGSLSETEGIPVEDDFMLNNLKAKMVVEIDNINNATFFEIPVEALEAPEIEELQ
ncbi:MAG: hypothetical protein K0Q97_1221 [Bacillota bacterium]|nr:hypothetical protein [Bacillota bacterium]